MDTITRQAISLFMDNYRALKKPLFLKTSKVHAKLCALSYSLENMRAKPEDLNESIRYIREHTKWYSHLRSSRILTAAFLNASNPNIVNTFTRLSRCCRCMKRAGFRSSPYMPTAALALFATVPEGLEQDRADDAYWIFRRIRKLHPFLTTREQYAASVIMSASGRKPEDALKDSENTLYHLINHGLRRSSGLQFLAGILTCDGSLPENKAARCIDISNTLKMMKFKIPSLFYGTIGFLALASDEWDDVIRDVLDTVSLLRLGKCFSSGDKETALMFASALVVNGFINGKGMGRPGVLKVCIGTTIQAVIEAQIIACASISGSAATATASD